MKVSDPVSCLYNFKQMYNQYSNDLFLILLALLLTASDKVKAGGVSLEARLERPCIANWF